MSWPNRNFLILLYVLTTADIVHPLNHTSNWAVLVCTSRYWFNYRHMSNALSIYRTVKRLGIPDSNILLMLADDAACNPRNKYPGQVFNNEQHSLNLYGKDIEVDYRGYEVTVENFVRVLTGRHDPAVPKSKRLLSSRTSNVLVYITGHGGRDFIKFQDNEELMAQDVADMVAQMWEKGRYGQLLLVAETCQAATLYSRIHSPNVLAMASSLKGESSYSHTTDQDVGLSLIDRFTHATLGFFEGITISSPATFADLFKTYNYGMLGSTFHHRTDLFPRPMDSVRLTEFFGNVATVKAATQAFNLTGEAEGVAAVSGASYPAAFAEAAGLNPSCAGAAIPAQQDCHTDRSRCIEAPAPARQVHQSPTLGCPEVVQEGGCRAALHPTSEALGQGGEGEVLVPLGDGTGGWDPVAAAGLVGLALCAVVLSWLQPPMQTAVQ